MSGPRRSSRHKKKDVQLVVSCLGPKSDAKLENKTSFYEIDIQSNIGCHENGAGKRKRKAPAGSAVKVPSKDSRTQTQEKAEDEVENPLVVEHYPKLNEIIYEERRPSPSQSTGFKAEAESLAEAEKEKERKSIVVDKKRLWTAAESQRKFDKHLKSYIIEHFAGEKRSELETVVQNYEEGLDGNEVHLHHHEHHHHHHYYANGKAVGSENGAPPLMFEETFNVSPEVFYAAMTASKERRDTERGESCQLLDGRPPDAAEESLEAPKEVPGESFERFATQGLEEGRRGSRTSLLTGSKKSSKNVQSSFTSFGVASGADFFLVNGGDEPTLVDNLEIHGLRVEKNKSSKTRSSLMESFKNIHHIMSPIVLTDHETVPKFWYIRCKCRPWSKDSGTPEEVEVRSLQESQSEPRSVPTPQSRLDRNGSFFFAEETNEPENASHGGVTTDTGENSSGLASETQKNEIDFTKEFEFEVWLAKLKDELCEIKNQLKRIEEKRLLGNGSTTVSFRNDKPLTDSNQITVYSSRTFIVQPSEDAIADA